LTIPPPSPDNPARSALAVRLAELRAAAGLSGNALAKRTGSYQSRVWKIENGSLLPSEDDIRAWARETGHEGEAESLMQMLAAARGEQAFTALLHRKGGAAAYQEKVRQLEQGCTVIGDYEVAVLPGFLHTADYTRELITKPGGMFAWGDDDPGEIERAVAARLRRGEILYDPAKQVQVVLGEGALRTMVARPAVMAGQMEKLLAAMHLPSVDIRVVGFGQVLPVYPLPFRIYDDRLAVVEYISGEREFTRDAHPEDMAKYAETWNVVRGAASTGDEAEAIIQRVLADLRGEQ
jgi:transcriptional regulator with XRE-family HTH domain